MEREENVRSPPVCLSNPFGKARAIACAEDGIIIGTGKPHLKIGILAHKIVKSYAYIKGYVLLVKPVSLRTRVKISGVMPLVNVNFYTHFASEYITAFIICEDGF